MNKTSGQLLHLPYPFTNLSKVDPVPLMSTQVLDIMIPKHTKTIYFREPSSDFLGVRLT